MRHVFLLAALLLALVAGALPSAASADLADQAHGAGTFTNWIHCPPTSTTTFDFSATSGPSGQSAAGTFSFECSAVGLNPGTAFSGVVTCLLVDRTHATLGGTVTASTHPIGTGSRVVFTVQDGGPAGEGDLISMLSGGPGCIVDDAITSLTAGDIVVVDAAEPPPSTPAAVVLTPPTAINDVGTAHTVTATATTAAGTPATGFTVLFTVTGSVSTTGACTTDAQGRCTFTYAGPPFPGADTITGCADANRNGQVDAGEPCGDATKVWTLPATTPGQVTGGGWIRRALNRVFFGLAARSTGATTTATGNCNVIDPAANTQIRCVTVDALVITPTHATLFGQATQNGVPTSYKIDVDDLNQGSLDTFTIVTTTGYAATGKLEAGNIQIRQ